MKLSKVLRQVHSEEYQRVESKSREIYLPNHPEETFAYRKGWREGFDRAIALAEAGEEEKDKNCSCYDGSGIICKEHFYGKKETEEE